MQQADSQTPLSGSAGVPARGVSLWRDYMSMTKPRIALMVLVTAAFGFFLAEQSLAVPVAFWIMLAGTGLAAGGSSVLNMYLERDVDGRMARTRNRPLPAGRIAPQHALHFGVLLALGGCFLLLWQVNLLAAFLTLLTTFLYVLVYTPLKRLSWLNTSIGAIPGAMPPLIGWAAATNDLSAGAWILFGILYLWQHPHFFAIAWLFREDYARGGFKMLSVTHPDGRRLFRQVIFFSLVLIPVSLLPTVIGMSGYLYALGALAIGLWMLAAGWSFTRQRTMLAARHLLRVSIVYLPLLLLLIMVDAAL